MMSAATDQKNERWAYSFFTFLLLLSASRSGCVHYILQKNISEKSEILLHVWCFTRFHQELTWLSWWRSRTFRHAVDHDVIRVSRTRNISCSFFCAPAMTSLWNSLLDFDSFDRGGQFCFRFCLFRTSSSELAIENVKFVLSRLWICPFRVGSADSRANGPRQLLLQLTDKKREDMTEFYHHSSCSACLGKDWREGQKVALMLWDCPKSGSCPVWDGGVRRKSGRSSAYVGSVKDRKITYRHKWL